MIRKKRFIIIVLIWFCCSNVIRSQAQDALHVNEFDAGKMEKLVSRLTELSEMKNNEIIKTTRRKLLKLKKLENKLSSKYGKVITEKAREDINPFRNIDIESITTQKNTSFLNSSNIPRLDSIVTALKFLQSKQVGNLSESLNDKQLRACIDKINALQSRFSSTNNLLTELKHAEKKLIQQYQTIATSGEILRLKKEIYYYGMQLNNYKEVLENPEKIEQQLLHHLGQNAAFRDFMKKYSIQAQIFRLPGSEYSDISDLALLQTRGSVIKIINQQFGKDENVKKAMGNNLSTAQLLLSKIKNRIGRYKNSGNSNIEIPDFKPNSQKVKSFIKRMEIGFNVQSRRSGSLLPAGSDFAVSVGYKINDKSLIGLGVSQKIGWGNPLKKLTVNNQGHSVRSFIDLKVKGKIWASGGFEINHFNIPSRNVNSGETEPYQKSMLVGLTKKFQATGGLKGNMKLLFDALHNKHHIQNQPLVFRIEYTLN